MVLVLCCAVGVVTSFLDFLFFMHILDLFWRKQRKNKAKGQHMHAGGREHNYESVCALCIVRDRGPRASFRSVVIPTFGDDIDTRRARGAVGRQQRG